MYKNYRVKKSNTHKVFSEYTRRWYKSNLTRKRSEDVYFSLAEMENEQDTLKKLFLTCQSVEEFAETFRNNIGRLCACNKTYPRIVTELHDYDISYNVEHFEYYDSVRKTKGSFGLKHWAVKENIEIHIMTPDDTYLIQTNPPEPNYINCDDVYVRHSEIIKNAYDTLEQMGLIEVGGGITSFRTLSIAYTLLVDNFKHIRVMDKLKGKTNSEDDYD